MTASAPVLFTSAKQIWPFFPPAGSVDIFSVKQIQRNPPYMFAISALRADTFCIRQAHA